jgi:hypothetical protein
VVKCKALSSTPSTTKNSLVWIILLDFINKVLFVGYRLGSKGEILRDREA